MSANFKPGDKVRMKSRGAFGPYPPGTYAGVLIGVIEDWPPAWWYVHIEGIQAPPTGEVCANEAILSPRDDPPPQQEPKREQVGDWDLCPWRPEVVTSL